MSQKKVSRRFLMAALGMGGGSTTSMPAPSFAKASASYLRVRSTWTLT